MSILWRLWAFRFISLNITSYGLLLADLSGESAIVLMQIPAELIISAAQDDLCSLHLSLYANRSHSHSLTQIRPSVRQLYLMDGGHIRVLLPLHSCPPPPPPLPLFSDKT